MTRYIQKSQVGFHFTLGSAYQEDGEYDGDWLYFKQCVPAIEDALRALPFWKLTPAEENDVMVVAPYELCDFDCEMECIDLEMTLSFWIESLRVCEVPREHMLAMRDAIASVMTARFVKAQTYLEFKDSNFTDVDL